MPLYTQGGRGGGTTHRGRGRPLLHTGGGEDTLHTTVSSMQYTHSTHPEERVDFFKYVSEGICAFLRVKPALLCDTG